MPGEARVEAVERALSLLEAFDGPPRLTLSELAARSGLYLSTVLRLAASLARFGYLHRDADGAFRLGPAPLRLGLRYQGAFNLAEQVRPALAALSARSGETAGFYVREGEHRICLFRHHPDRAIRHHVEEGARLPLDRGAGGRVLAAFTGALGVVGARHRFDPPNRDRLAALVVEAARELSRMLGGAPARGGPSGNGERL